MTYRQWLAGQALTGLLSGDTSRYQSNRWQGVAEDAVTMADELIAELDKET